MTQWEVVIQHNNGRETVDSTWQTFEDAEEAWKRTRERGRRLSMSWLNVYTRSAEQEQKP